ncbi:MAG: hypothetical protein HY552_04105 [Elusimicrobia bacterium]|nr:hypothetical protein [Elusimicrobiota bacterium]
MEQGVAMLSSVLKSERAIQVNIGIMRAFVRMRRTVAEHRQLASRLDHLERNTEARFEVVFDEMRRLRAQDQEERIRESHRRIGFQP